MGKSNVIKEKYESPKIHYMKLENEHVLSMMSYGGGPGSGGSGSGGSGRGGSGRGGSGRGGN